MKRTPSELFEWSKTRRRMDELLRGHYQACATDELPTQILAVLKKLRDETQAERQKTGETKIG
jgi:hypothetical protein